MNYFELFGYTPAPAIDSSDLARRYFDLQRRYHPDKFTMAGEEEKEDALRMSSAANEGFAIFRDRDKTLAYFLEIKGAIDKEEKFQLPADFLMEMMELNELAEENKEAFSKATGEFALSLQKEINSILERTRDSEINQIDIQQLKLYHFKKKYLSRVLGNKED